MKNLIYLSLISLFIFGCGAEDQTKETSPDLNVKVAIAKTQPTPEIYTFTGKVISNHSINISTKLMGRIEYLAVEEGEQIKEGQTLLRISNNALVAKRAAAQANLSKAQARLENVKKDYKRINTLYEKGSATEKEKDEISYALESAKAQVNALKYSIDEVNELLTYATINAPFNGFVTKKYVERGDLANPGAPLLTIESLSDFKVVAKIPESELSAISRNDEVKVVIQSLNKSVKGKITQINPSSLSGNLQFEATIKLDGAPDPHIKSGMYAEIRFTRDSEEKLLLPKDVVIRQGQLTGIYTVNNQDKTSLRWLRLGKEYESQVEVLSGLRAGEKYITQSNNKLHSGLTVEVQK